MERVLALIVCVLLAAGSAIGQQRSASSRTADLRAIEALEMEWNRANEVSDAEAKRRLLAEDSYHVGPSGRLYNKQQDVEEARLAYERKQNDKSITKFYFENRKIRLYKNVAVVTATGWSIVTRDGVERRGRSFRGVGVWEKRGGHWQLVVDQVTGVAN